MQRPVSSFMAILTLPLFLFLFLCSTVGGHNITRILANQPEFSTYNHYLTATHLAAEINRRQTITVLALDNSAMSSLLTKHLSISTLKNVLSLHVLVDYFGARKLHQLNKGTTLTASMFQSTGSADGTSGYVNITNLKSGKVGFGTEDGSINSMFVKSVKEMPYNISVIQISQALTSNEAEAPTAAPSQFNVTAIMAKQGCKAFADLLRASKSALKSYDESVEGGLTVFCPTDAVLNGFMPKYKNLTDAQKVSLLLYHATPVYESLQMLKSNNGGMNTLATDGANKYDFTVQNDGEDIQLETKVNTATIVGTLIDQDPLVVYKINKVLMPRELFKPTTATAAEPAEAPKAHKKATADAPDDDDADSPSTEEDDQKAANDNGAITGLDGRRLILVALSVFVGVLTV